MAASSALLSRVLGAGAIAIALLGATPLAASGFNIHGEYCGKALSGGEMVEVHTRLKAGPDGLLTGDYEFVDGAEITRGDLQEYVGADQAKRRLVWRDKYGTGMAAFQFDDTGDSFVGAWGVDFSNPDFPWDGKRCNAPVS